jgi:hypothetical protein
MCKAEDYQPGPPRKEPEEHVDGDDAGGNTNKQQEVRHDHTADNGDGQQDDLNLDTVPPLEKRNEYVTLLEQDQPNETRSDDSCSYIIQMVGTKSSDYHPETKSNYIDLKSSDVNPDEAVPAIPPGVNPQNIIPEQAVPVLHSSVHQNTVTEAVQAISLANQQNITPEAVPVSFSSNLLNTVTEAVPPISLVCHYNNEKNLEDTSGGTTLNAGTHTNIPKEVKKEQEDGTVATTDEEKDTRDHEKDSNTQRQQQMMELFHAQKYKCPARFKELHSLGTQSLLLKKTQDYIKELQDARKMIRFEISFQKMRERKRQMYRQTLVREDCCERMYSYSLHKKYEAKERKEKINKAKKERNTKPFNIYAAFGNQNVS